MTFTNFLQVLAFNLLSSTIPLCILLYVTALLTAKMFEKRFDKYIDKKVSKMFESFNSSVAAKKRQLADED